MKLDIDQTFWSTKRTLVPVRYTDSEGRMQYFDLKLGYGLGLQDDYDFPVITDNIEPLINIQNAPSLLDSNGIFAHTHHISIVTDNADEIVVVRNFAFLNQIVNEGALIEYRVYGSDVPFNIFNDKVRSSDTSLSVSVEWSSEDYALRLTSSIQEPHWAWADTDGNILAAFNNYDGNEWIYFNYMGSRGEAGLMLNVLNGDEHVQSYDVWGLVSVQPSVDVRAQEHQATFNITADVETHQSGYVIEAETSTHAFSQTGDVSFEEITAADEWEYIGTSGTEDDSVNAGSEESCRTSSEIKTWLDSNEPASDYREGYIIKVNHGYYVDQDNFGTCTSYYYEAIKN